MAAGYMSYLQQGGGGGSGGEGVGVGAAVGAEPMDAQEDGREGAAPAQDDNPDPRITFLYKLVPGVAPASFGM